MYSPGTSSDWICPSAPTMRESSSAPSGIGAGCVATTGDGFGVTIRCLFAAAASLPQNFADPLPPLQLGLELLQLGPKRVSSRHHADRLAVFDHGYVPEAALEHQVQRVTERLVRLDRARVRRHDFGKPRRLRIEALRQH